MPTLKELRNIAKSIKLKGYTKLKKSELESALLAAGHKVPVHIQKAPKAHKGIKKARTKEILAELEDLVRNKAAPMRGGGLGDPDPTPAPAPAPAPAPDPPLDSEPTPDPFDSIPSETPSEAPPNPADSESMHGEPVPVPGKEQDTMAHKPAEENKPLQLSMPMQPDQQHTQSAFIEKSAEDDQLKRIDAQAHAMPDQQVTGGGVGDLDLQPKSQPGQSYSAGINSIYKLPGVLMYDSIPNGGENFNNMLNPSNPGTTAPTRSAISTGPGLIKIGIGASVPYWPTGKLDDIPIHIKDYTADKRTQYIRPRVHGLLF